MSQEYQLIAKRAIAGAQSSPKIKPSRLVEVYEIARQICSLTDMEILPGHIMTVLEKYLPGERCIIARVDTGGTVQVLQHNLESLPGELADWPVCRTAIKSVLADGDAVLFIDRIESPDVMASVKSKNISSFICSPLTLQSKPEGFVYVDTSTRRQSIFSKEDLSFLSLVAVFIGIALNNAQEFEETRQQMHQTREALLHSKIVGSSAMLKKAFDELRRLARADVPVLLYGEPGTGKELFAEATHTLSQQSKGRYEAVNMAAIPRDMLESELFGHVAGSFTGALRNRKGRFELAHHGTLFMDEIGELDISLQPKLLRAVENKRIRKLGAETDLEVDVRIVCATNRNLKDMVASKTFRQDLHDRLAGFSIHIPPLRERKDDIPLLVAHFQKQSGSSQKYTAEALNALQNYSWPGNIRELGTVIKRIDILCDAQTITSREVRRYLNLTAGKIPPAGDNPIRFPQQTAFPSLAAVEQEHILTVAQHVEALGGTREDAAQILGIGRSTLCKKLTDYQHNSDAEQTVRKSP
jgi:two-component system, NtrC family, response regulator HydG